MTAAAPQLVIFDCDGVLVDSEPISNEGWRASDCRGLSGDHAEAIATYKGRLLSDVVELAGLARKPAAGGFRRGSTNVKRTPSSDRLLRAIDFWRSRTPSSASERRARGLRRFPQGKAREDQFHAQPDRATAAVRRRCAVLGLLGAARQAAPGPVPVRGSNDGRQPGAVHGRRGHGARSEGCRRRGDQRVRICR